MAPQRRPVEHELAERVFQISDLGVPKETLISTAIVSPPRSAAMSRSAPRST